MSTYGASQLAASFRTVRKNTIQIAEEIPEDKYSYQSAPGTRTVAQMLVHIAVSPDLWRQLNQEGLTTLENFDFMSAFSANAAEEAKARTKEEIVELLRSTGELFAGYLEGLSDEFLAVDVALPGGHGTKSRLESLMSAKEHEMHHRAQLMLIERQLGMVPHLTRIMQERFQQMQAAKA